MPRRNHQIEELPTFTKWLPRSVHGRPDETKAQPPQVVPNLRHQEQEGEDEDEVAVVASGPMPRGCLPPFYICCGGRRISAAATAPDITKDDGVAADRNSKSEGWRCLPAFGRRRMAAVAPDLREEEKAVAVVAPDLRGEEKAVAVVAPDLRGEEKGVATVAPDLRGEEKGVATVAPDLRGESGCCCAQRGCLPAFPICGRRRVAADVPDGEGVVSAVVDLQKKTVSESDDSVSAQRKGCLPAFHLCAGSKRVARDSDLHKEEAVAVAGVVDLQEKVVSEGDGDGSRSTRRRGCLPAFHICAGRKGVAGASDRRKEVAVVAVADVVDLQEKDVSEGDDSRSVQRKGCSPAFHICAGKRAVAGASDRRKEVVVAVADVVGFEEKSVSEGDGSRYAQRRGCSPAFHICGRKGAATVSDLHKEEAVVASVVDLQEKGVTDGDDSVSAQPRGCLPALHICGRKGTAAVSYLPEEEAVAAAGVPDLTEEHSKSSRRGCCWPKFHMCGGRWVPAGDIPDLHEEKAMAAAGIPDLRQAEVAAAGIPDLRKEVSAGRVSDPRKEAVAANVPDLRKKAMAADVISDLRKEEPVVAGIQEHGKDEEEGADGASDLGQETDGGCCGFFRCGRKRGNENSCRSRNSRSERGCWMFQSCRSWWFPTLHICGGRKKVSVGVADPREEEGLVAAGVSARYEEVVAAAPFPVLHQEEFVAASSIVFGHDKALDTGRSRSKSTRRCGCRGGCLSQFRTCRRRKTASDGEEEDGRRRSKPKRKGCLRRRGRRHREGKDRKRERKKFKFFNCFK